MDLKLIRVCFKTSSNIYPFPTVYTRFRKRNNVIYDMLKMLLRYLKSLEYYVFNCLYYKIISHSKLKTKTAKNHYGNFNVFLFIHFRSKSVLIFKIYCKHNP